MPQVEKSNQSLPLKPLSSRKPETDWVDEISDFSDENVNIDDERVMNSSLDLPPGLKKMPLCMNPDRARHVSVANLFLFQSKENSPSASPLRERNSKSPVEHVDPKGVPADPRFELTQDIEDAIDVSQETEEETTGESLHGHFKVLYDKEEPNTVEEVKATYMRVLGEAECNVSADFLLALPPRILWLRRNL